MTDDIKRFKTGQIYKNCLGSYKVVKRTDKMIFYTNPEYTQFLNDITGTEHKDKVYRAKINIYDNTEYAIIDKATITATE